MKQERIYIYIITEAVHKYREQTSDYRGRGGGAKNVG